MKTRTICIVVLLLVLGCYIQRDLLGYGVNYLNLFIEIMNEDDNRITNDVALIAKNEWELYQLQSQYNQNICKSKRQFNSSGYLWLTVFVNDEYAVPAIVLGHSIRTLSCAKKMIALVSNEVSPTTKEALSKVGWAIHVVPAMDCKWMQRKLGQNPTSTRIKGTHTRFHAWNYTDFSKIIYTDPDYMLLSNIDELFEINADFAATYCSRPGIIDPCFNAGLMAFRPNTLDYHAILTKWENISKESCPSDQMLLTYYYAFSKRWSRLPYAYNVRRIIYHPMKAFHFVRHSPVSKPWRSKCRPSRNEARRYNQPITSLQNVSQVYWKMFYEALSIYGIDSWWQNTKFFDKQMEFGEHLFSECWREQS